MNKINFLLLCIILLYGCSDDNMYNTRFFSDDIQEHEDSYYWYSCYVLDVGRSNENDKIVMEINNVTITSPRVYGGDIIKFEQVMVYPTGVLILSADDVIEINPPFTVQSGATFEFYTY